MKGRLILCLLLLFLAGAWFLQPRKRDWRWPVPRIPPAQRHQIDDLEKRLNLKMMLLPPGQVGRNGWPMEPRYITVHSTGNATADATAHGRALLSGALRGHNRTGYLTWHFTVDAHCVVQHLSTREQGEHADFKGEGNKLSIGIEMCELENGDLPATVGRTAMLTAVLAYRHGIPLEQVVPHAHWERISMLGEKLGRKECPGFLLKQGKTAEKWAEFIKLARHYYEGLPKK